jgi:hypothetical protein
VLSLWVRDADFPGGVEGPWHLDKVVRWCRERNKFEGVGVGSRKKPPEDPDDMFRWEKARLLQLKRQEMERLVLPREAVRAMLEKVAASYRRCREQLVRECGIEAGEILDEGTDEAEREVNAYFRHLAAADAFSDV